ncbi:MAG: hypothetical protein ACOCYG_08700 [Spirochaetota bacterium]
MIVRELTDIRRKEDPLYYRRHYTATATMNYLGEKTSRIPVDFTIEHDALGGTTVSVRPEADIDYPRVPLLRALKEHSRRLDQERKLP